MASTVLRVKELLKERSWTTKILSEKTGMSESYLTHIKNGTRRWNEDALKKIASAFELDPIDLFAIRRTKDSLSDVTVDASDKGTGLLAQERLITKIPVMGEIPAYPSAYNNEVAQITTGYKEMFVPVIGFAQEPAFALCVENNTMAPTFVKGDYLVFSPHASVASGDIVAIEYKQDRLCTGIMHVSFAEDFVVLESVNHRQLPIALAKGKDLFRIIGKLVYRYQRFN